MGTDLTKLLVVIGSAKSGTTALAHYLGSRADIRLGDEKEPKHFTNFAQMRWTGPASEGFLNTLLADRATYEANFPDLAPGQWALDASTDYIWCEASPDLLHQFGQTADLRLICVTRDPLARAISEYNHTLRHGWETLSFRDALAAEPERIAQGWHPLFYHRRRSTIAADVARYHALFGERLLILDYDELAAPDTLLTRISDFLDLDPPEELAPMERKNTSRLPRNRMLGQLLQSESAKVAARHLLPQALRQKLWRGLHTDASAVKTVHEAEIDALREAMADEIAACQASPLIHTDNWHLSLPAPPQSARSTR